LAAERGVAERVHFAGFLENPFPIIRAAAAYVLPSNAEGFPNGLVEAMVSGTPVISTDCRSGPSEILDGRPELLTHELHRARYGILVPANDRDAMVAALVLATAPGERERLSQMAIAGAARFGLGAAVEEYWATINGALVGEPGVPR
jgi:glycosyltransferase involved in cell wall biosynthesis